MQFKLSILFIAMANLSASTFKHANLYFKEKVYQKEDLEEIVVLHD